MYLDKEILMQELANHECLLADGCESALIGISEGPNPVAVYDTELCIKALMDNDDMNPEEAVEYFYFNTVNCFIGDKTPLFIKTLK